MFAYLDGFEPYIMLGLAGVAVLYGVLQIGKDIKGWAQLD